MEFKRGRFVRVKMPAPARAICVAAAGMSIMAAAVNACMHACDARRAQI